jgi:hypothetical protein
MAERKVTAATPHRRLSLRARHLIRTILRTRHSTVQRVAISELAGEVNRHHTTRRTPVLTPGETGIWVRHSAKLRHVMSRLRYARNWKVQQQLVREATHEIVEAEVRAERWLRFQQAMRRHGNRVVRAGRWTVRRVRAGGTRVRQAYLARVAEGDRPRRRARRSMSTDPEVRTARSRGRRFRSAAERPVAERSEAATRPVRSAAPEVPAAERPAARPRAKRPAVKSAAVAKPETAATGTRTRTRRAVAPSTPAARS